MSDADRTISVRALNYLRNVHVPSYVGLRFLLDQLPDAQHSIAVTTLVEQMAHSKNSRMYGVKRFKRFIRGIPEYREYSVPAPTHALAEAYSLYELQKHGLRSKASYVYSYRTPRSLDYKRSYEYFSAGYANRNADVLSSLDRDSVALVFDLEKFYPSVDASAVVSDLVELSERSGIAGTHLRVIEKCATACIQPGETSKTAGLRVGPDLSHFLADIALRGIDGELSVRYKNRYFRYVDDLVVVIPRSRVNSETVTVRSIVESHGFKLNAEKETTATRELWAGYKNRYLPDDDQFDPLSAFKFRLKLFLARKTEQRDRVSEYLKGMGVFLPLESLQEATTSTSWRMRVLRLLSLQWPTVLRYRFDDVGDIVSNAHECQEIIRRQVLQLTSKDISNVALTRRWQVQQARFLINRALYFLPTDELSALVQFMRALPELDETAAVAQSVVSGDFSRVAVMPGPAASASAQLAAIRGVSPNLVFPSVLQASDPAIAADIASHFAVRGFGSEFSLGPDGGSGDSSALLRFSFAQDGNADASEAVGFGQELEWLGANLPREARARAAATRLYPDEDVVLEALSLSAAYMS